MRKELRAECLFGEKQPTGRERRQIIPEERGGS